MTERTTEPRLMTGDLARHSMSIIAANQTASGAFLASPTFPTYRYCWFRDGTYIAYALDLAAEHERAARFYQWAVEMILQRGEKAKQAISLARSGTVPPEEDLLHTRYLPDGSESTEEWPNFQLDGFGTLLWGMREHLVQTDQPLPAAWQPAVLLLIDYLNALWHFPCFDCWEEYGDKIHTATLAAIYGGLTAATSLVEVESCPAIAEIPEFVHASCIADGSLCKFVGNPAADGSLIHATMPYRLLAPDDLVMRQTVSRIERELRENGGGVHRYRLDNYYGGGEWILLTAYLGCYYVEMGDVARADALRQWIEAQADETGELPEQVPEHLYHPDMLPIWQEHWGPIANPLLWSHAAYLTLLAYLARLQ